MRIRWPWRKRRPRLELVPVKITWVEKTDEGMIDKALLAVMNMQFDDKVDSDGKPWPPLYSWPPK